MEAILLGSIIRIHLMGVVFKEFKVEQSLKIPESAAKEYCYGVFHAWCK